MMLATNTGEEATSLEAAITSSLDLLGYKGSTDEHLLQPLQSCVGVGAGKGLLIFAANGVQPNTLKTQLLAEPGVTQVDTFNAQFATPSLAQLQAYDFVVSFSNNLFADPTTLGNNLADYADGGGAVIAANFDFASAAGKPLAGRWITGGYTPYQVGGTAAFSTSTLGTYDAAHPIMRGVTTLSSTYRQTLTLAAGATEVAKWADGKSLIATKTQNGHRGVGINSYFGDDAPPVFTGQFAKVIANSALFIHGCSTPILTAAANQSSNEGIFTAFNLGSFTDPDGTPWTVDVDWGDGSAHTTFNEVAAGSLGTQSHAYADNGTYTATVVVTDSTGLSDTKAFNVTVSNVVPTATFSNGGSVNEGSTGTVSFSNQADPSPTDVSAGLHYAYDYNNDGTFDSGDGTYAGSGTSASATVPASFFADGPGTRVVRGRIIDKDGGFSDYTTTITINNVSPTATLSNGGAVNEGSTGTVSFSNQADPSAADTAAGFHYAYDFNNDGTFEIGDGTYGGSGTTASATVPATYLDDGPATRTVKARIIDKDGGFTDYTTNITVNNVAPIATFSNGGAVNEGSTGTVSFSAPSDPSSADTAAGFHYAYDFDNNGTFESGDGTYAGSASSATATVPASFLDDGPGTRTVKGRIIDKDGGFTDYTTTITINNVDPTATLSNGGPYVFGQPGTVSFSNQTDPSAADTTAGFHYSYDFDNNGTFDDGDGTYAGSGTASSKTVPPQYLSVGTHVVKGRILDKDNGSTDYTTTIIVNKANTATSVVGTPNPSVFGQVVTFTATIVPVPPGAGTPTGTVSFNVDGTVYCPNTALNGSSQASCNVAGSPSLGAGSHPVVVTYSGDGNFNGSLGSTVQVVNKAVTATTITADSPDPTTVGQPYTVSWSTAVVSPGAGNPTGTVTVSDGAGGTCTAAVTAGSCSMSSPTVGSKTLTAVYSGDANFSGSTSAGVAHTVNVVLGGNIQQYVAGGPNTNLSGATVTLSGCTGGASQTTTTDAAGNYTFTGPYTGTCTLTPSGFSKVYDPISRTVSAASNASNLNFVAYNAGAVPRDLRVVNGYTAPGQPVTVPVVLTALGGESSMSFTLNYDISPFSGLPTVACGSGSGANCNLTVTYPSPGKVAISVTPTAAYSAGQQQVVTVTFQTLPTSLYNTPITFAAAPAATILDGGSNPIPFTLTNGFVVFQQGLEGDLAGRPVGDGQLLSNDVTIERQMVVGTLTPDPNYNEFQRADVAPAGTKGDGQLNATDVVQERRYVLGLNQPVGAGGAFFTGGVIAPPVNTHDTGRAMKIVDTNAVAGNKVSVDVTLDAAGDEAATSFTLNFDAMKLSNPTVTLGSGAPQDSTLTVGTADAKDGRVSVLIDSMNSFEKAAGRQVVTITFDVAAKAPTGDTEIGLTSGSISDAQARGLAATYTSGKVSIGGPNSVGVSISGRILTPEGAGLRNAVVTLTDAAGNVRTANSASLGYYTFDSVPTGAEYTITVTSKRYRFSSRKLTARDNLAGVDFTGTE